jgi:hypothetical protein
LQKQFDLLLQIRNQLTRIYDTVNQVEDVRTQVSGLKRRLPESVSYGKVSGAADDLDKKLLAIRDDLIQVKVKSNEDSLSYPQKVDAKFAFLAMGVGGENDSVPTDAAYRQFDRLKKQVDEILTRWQDVQKTDLVEFQRMVSAQNIRAIVVPSVESAAGSESDTK